MTKNASSVHGKTFSFVSTGWGGTIAPPAVQTQGKAKKMDNKPIDNHLAIVI